MPNAAANPTSEAPQWTATARELDDLDVLVKGCLEPTLSGFADAAATGPERAVTLAVSPEAADKAIAAGALVLVDPEGAPLASLRPDASYPTEDGRVGLAGPVSPLAANAFGPFRSLYLSPAQMHSRVPASELLAVPVRRPLGDAEMRSITEQAAESGRTPLLLACVGDGMPLRMTAPGLIRATRLAAADLPGGAEVVAASVADHGDVAVNRWLIDAVSAAYGSETLLLGDQEPSDVPAKVAAVVARERPPRHEQGVVFFFTGLSGSGKSTLARALADHLLEQGERTVTSLDGDVVRHHLSKGLGFSREDRETNILRIGFVAAEIARHRGVAICSPIAPFAATRAEVRRMVERVGGGFVLIHVATPLEECERRDRKGLYARARAGLIPDFTGISSPYEEPVEAIKVDTTNRDILECLEDILAAATAEGWPDLNDTSEDPMLYSAATFLAGSPVSATEVKTAVAGLLVGTIVGITGMGGGALMTPALIFLGVGNASAVVTADLTSAAVYKTAGAGVHWREGSPNFRLAGWLILGSVPFAFLGPHLVRWVAPSSDVNTTLQRFIGIALLLAATTYAGRLYLQLRRVTSKKAARPKEPVIRPIPTVIVGAVGGLLVGITSVGSGSVIMIALLMLYPTLSAVRLVGTDLVQAVPLVLAAAVSNIMTNGLDWRILIPLIIGSVPGSIIGSKLAPRVPSSMIRRGLVVVLTVSGLALLDKSGWWPTGNGPDGDTTHPVTIILIGVGILVVLPFVWGLLRRNAGLPMFGRPTVAEIEAPASVEPPIPQSAAEADQAAAGSGMSGLGSDVRHSPRRAKAGTRAGHG